MTVYFVTRDSDRAVKIGFTDKSGKAAKIYMRSRSAGGRPLVTTPGRRVVERWFHLRHQTAQIANEHGGPTEWFRRSAALMADVVEISERGRVKGQPIEPSPGLRIPGEILLHIRRDILGVEIDEFAALTGCLPVTVFYAEREDETTTIVRAVNIEYAAKKKGIDLTVGYIVKLIRSGRAVRPREEEYGAWKHRLRYRTHIVREIAP